MTLRGLFTTLALILLTAPLIACAPSRVDHTGDAAGPGTERGFGDVLADQQLRSRIVAGVLNDDELLQESNINVTVFNRIVLLTGEVPRVEAGRRIASLARQQDDARHVYNELMVAELSSLMARSRDSLMATSARARILRLDEPSDLDSDRVRVVVERRRIYLMGLVTREEADAISETVRQVGGAREVVRLFEYLD